MSGWVPLWLTRSHPAAEDRETEERDQDGGVKVRGRPTVRRHTFFGNARPLFGYVRDRPLRRRLLRVRGGPRSR